MPSSTSLPLTLEAGGGENGHRQGGERNLYTAPRLPTVAATAWAARGSQRTHRPRPSAPPARHLWRELPSFGCGRGQRKSASIPDGDLNFP